MLSTATRMGTLHTLYIGFPAYATIQKVRLAPSRFQSLPFYSIIYAIGKWCISKGVCSYIGSGVSARVCVSVGGSGVSARVCVAVGSGVSARVCVAIGSGVSARVCVAVGSGVSARVCVAIGNGVSARVCVAIGNGVSAKVVFGRTHYRRQKRWWSAYLLFYVREDMEKVFEGGC